MNFRARSSSAGSTEMLNDTLRGGKSVEGSKSLNINSINPRCWGKQSRRKLSAPRHQSHVRLSLTLSLSISLFFDEPENVCFRFEDFSSPENCRRGDNSMLCFEREAVTVCSLEFSSVLLRRRSLRVPAAHWYSLRAPTQKFPLPKMIC